jgi:hypothetical protein
MNFGASFALSWLAMLVAACATCRSAPPETARPDASSPASILSFVPILSLNALLSAAK